MEGSKLIFSLDCCEEGPIVSFSKDSEPLALEMDLKLNQGRTSQASSLPHSPSFPGSLSDMCSAYEPLTTNLIKSASSDLEPKEDSPLKDKPHPSLVKSLSTEISCRAEHDDNLSKSDSKLHLHPRKQLIQQKILEPRHEEVELLNEPKGTSLIAEFEDTRRKFSEAMQDPLSMFSKIIGDESPKQGRSMSTGDSTVSYVPDLKCRKKTDSDHKDFSPFSHTLGACVTGGQSSAALSSECQHPPLGITQRNPPEPATFVHTRVYQLTDCKVSLLPSGLARKRIWNKKYPICIILPSGEDDGLEEGKDKAEKLATLYLFGRTGRDKEEWFQRFLSASKPEPTSCNRDEADANTACIGEHVQDVNEELVDLMGAVKTRTLVDYNTYMFNLIGSENYEAIPSPTDKEDPMTNKNAEIFNKDNTCGVQPGAEIGAHLGAPGCSAEREPHWVNSLVGRVFWDFLREKYWTDQVAHKIQKKLSKIKLPYFMNELKLADLDMGTCLPQVISTSKPTLDQRGLWLEMEVIYTGCLHMTLETKMNLCKLGKDSEDSTEKPQEPLQFGSKPRLSILADSDEESSSASSSDEEDVFEPVSPSGLKSNVVADGYSFRVPPRLDLHVRPMLGEREVTFTHVTEWIEKKLQCEFQKVFVMPNMDDLYLPLMTSGLESTPGSKHSSVASSQQSSIESQEYLPE
ncbi:hypothetical protein WMY93_003645 [Mugilogobius chulae]|uniref:SMP-LTD domain-containing protein n=1 Tax=Mugilogobius chulae TaxID=88201 RepID=A0AAW0Q832_9GOBI